MTFAKTTYGVLGVVAALAILIPMAVTTPAGAQSSTYSSPSSPPPSSGEPGTPGDPNGSGGDGGDIPPPPPEQQLAKIEMRRRLTLIGAMMLHKGEVDGMLCGTWSNTAMHLQYIDQVIGKRPGVKNFACMNGLMLPNGAGAEERSLALHRHHE